MSEKYIPLYRKYRPKNLQEVVGQEHIKKALTNAINLGKISHAYLFTGPRGTGKTSSARILAKSLNCQQGPTLTPCEVCPSCEDIKNSNPIDVIEIDAASNRKVEDARDILEKIQYIPVNGKYKIYIIDEVHMLTKEAFNTLLKTLEEPPENVIFILATTEPQKVLETIISRCQRFDFRRITTEDIVNHLKNISKLEKIKIEDEALFTIAKNAAGGMRDSLALLDQVSVLGSTSSITSEDVNKLLGRLSFDMLNEFSDKIIQSAPQEAIELLDKIYNSGNEPVQILTNLLAYFKNLLIVKNCSDENLLLDLTQANNSQISALKKQSEEVDTHQIIFLIEKIANYIKELKISTNQHLWLEIAVIDLANLAQNTSLLQLQERISRLEANQGGQAPQARTFVAQPVQTAPRPIQKEEKPVERLKATAVKEEDSKEEIKISKAPSKEPESVPSQQEDDFVPVPVSKPSEKGSVSSDVWVELLKNISSPPVVSLINQHARPIEISEQKIIIGCEKEFAVKMLNGDVKKKAILDAAKNVFGKDVNVIIKQASESEFASVQKKNPITAPKNNPEPAELKKQEESEDVQEEDDFVEHELSKKKKKVEKVIISDQVSMVMNLFDGKYID